MKQRMGDDIMSTDSFRYEQAREHLGRLVGLYAATEDIPENADILRDLEWLAEQMAMMSADQLLDTVAPGDPSPQPEPSSEPKGRRAA
jgi:hypothetical protein